MHELTITPIGLKEKSQIGLESWRGRSGILAAKSGYVPRSMEVVIILPNGPINADKHGRLVR